MDRMEKLESEYPELKISLDPDMPPHQGGFIYKHEVILNSNKTYQETLGNLAEEIGHYETSSGDVLHAPYLENGQQEYRARAWGYEKLVSLDDLIDCYVGGDQDIDMVLERLDVTLEYLTKAIDYYRQKYGVVFAHNGYVFDLNNGLNIYPKLKRKA